MYSSTVSLTFALKGVGGNSTTRPIYPRTDPVPIVQKVVSATGPLWTDAGILAPPPPPTGIRSPELPARRESLYRLSYPGSRLYVCNVWNTSMDITECMSFRQFGLA